jgi:hypothetical protein
VADRKITDLTALTTPASADVLPIVDVSEAAAADKNKKITVGELFKGVPDGTAAAPSVAFTGSGTDTGIYSPGVDQVAVATNGNVYCMRTAYGGFLRLHISYLWRLQIRGGSFHGEVLDSLILTLESFRRQLVRLYLAMKKLPADRRQRQALVGRLVQQLSLLVKPVQVLQLLRLPVEATARLVRKTLRWRLRF